MIQYLTSIPFKHQDVTDDDDDDDDVNSHALPWLKPIQNLSNIKKPQINLFSYHQTETIFIMDPAVVAWWFSICFIRSVIGLQWIKSRLWHGTIYLKIDRQWTRYLQTCVISMDKLKDCTCKEK